MSLQSLLDISRAGESAKTEISEERLRKIEPELRKMIAFYRMYPDIFVDDICGPDSSFKLFHYQRVFLRIGMRYKYCFATYPRAFSKSFLTVLILMLRCILYPNSQLSVTTGGK